MGLMSETRALLHVCITCRAGVEPPGAGGSGERPVPGACLHDRLQALLADRHDAPVRVLGARCLANCEQGCSAAIAMGGKWSYLLGGLGPDHASDLLDYAAVYAASATGVVMPSKRPASLANAVHGRIPPLPQSETEQPA